jgi:hypothetical protein
VIRNRLAPDPGPVSSIGGYSLWSPEDPVNGVAGMKEGSDHLNWPSVRALPLMGAWIEEALFLLARAGVTSLFVVLLMLAFY